MTIRLSEAEIRFFVLILLPLARVPDHSLSEAQLIEFGERSKWLTRQERSSVASRTDSRFANMIHRVVYHRTSRTNPLRLKLLEWDSRHSSFKGTARGFDFLNQAAARVGKGSADFLALERWLTAWAHRENGRGA